MDQPGSEGAVLEIVSAQLGPIDEADGAGYAKSDCGDWVRMWIKLDAQGRIADARFRYFGCGSVLATSSVLAVLAKGLTLAEAGRIGVSDVERFLGAAQRHKAHCSSISLQAFHLALADCQRS